jgi:tetratricopeptide (TPR) repeat protein
MRWCGVLFLLAASFQGLAAESGRWENDLAKGRGLVNEGRYGEARDVFEKLRQQSEAPEPGNPRLAIALNNLGIVYIHLNDISTAERCYRRSAAIWTQIGDTADSLTPLTNLAAVYMARGQYHAAESLLRDARDGAARMLGPEAAGIAVIDTYLADSALRRRDYAEAVVLGARALEIVRKSRGAASPEAAIALGNLGVMYRAQGATDESSRLFAEAIEVLEKSAQPDHPGWISALQNYGGMLFDEDRFAESEKVLNQALRMAENSLGPNHPKVARILSQRAMLLRKTGRKREAKKLETRAAKIEQESGRKNTIGYTVDLQNITGYQQ